MIKIINIDTTLIAYTRISDASVPTFSDASEERRRTYDSPTINADFSDASAERRHSCRRTNEGLTRRDREKEAVEQIIRHIAGAKASLTHTADGAPLLPDYNISVTHSREIAAVAFDKERKIGIDAEEWRPTLSRVASRFLSEEELNLFTTPDQLLRAWTAKEAVYKIIGAPAVDFRASISLSPDLTTAQSCGQTLILKSFTIDKTLINLAKSKTI